MVALLFNGPPGSGKDAACSHLEEELGFKHLTFKRQLFLETIEHYGVSEDWFMGGYDREGKERPEELLGGLSRRGALIHVSEDLVKPVHGKEYFGEKLAQQAVGESLICVSDSGFVEEAKPLLRFLGNDLVVVRLLRDGCDFSIDSRRYIRGCLPKLEVVVGHRSLLPEEDDFHPGVLPARIHVLHNNGSLEELKSAVVELALWELQGDFT